MLRWPLKCLKSVLHWDNFDFLLVSKTQMLLSPLSREYFEREGIFGPHWQLSDFDCKSLCRSVGDVVLN